VAVRCKYGLNGYSAGNYQLKDEESTGGMVIPPGITSSWTKYPPGITSSWTRNPLGEWLFRRESPKSRLKYGSVFAEVFNKQLIDTAVSLTPQILNGLS
jgi:hypothetical protein